MQMSDKVDKIFPALVKAQSELSHAVKDSTNPHFKSRYADLTAVWEAAKPVLTGNELAALQDAVSTEAGVGVRTRIIHTSGQWIEFDPPIIPLDKRNAQGTGSALTYGRRYSLSAALGVVADEDDDGNAASNGKNGSGVADAQSSKKTAVIPGISALRQQVTEAARELHSCSDDSQFAAYLPTISKLCLEVCMAAPDLWIGPEEGSGLKGTIETVATNLGTSADTWLGKVEEKARKAQPKQAAE